MTNTLLLKLRERLCEFKSILHFCVLGRTQSLFILMNIVYAVLPGKHFLSLTTERKEKDIGLENFANCFL